MAGHGSRGGRRGVRALTGQVCPRCSGFAALEPGGLRCLRCGYTPLFRCVLPRDHWLSGRDWRNRQRQHALDRTLMNSGRASDFLFDMLEALEGNRKTVSAATA